MTGLPWRSFSKTRFVFIIARSSSNVYQWEPSRFFFGDAPLPGKVLKAIGGGLDGGETAGLRPGEVLFLDAAAIGGPQGLFKGSAVIGAEVPETLGDVGPPGDGQPAQCRYTSGQGAAGDAAAETGAEAAHQLKFLLCKPQSVLVVDDVQGGVVSAQL